MNKSNGFVGFLLSYLAIILNLGYLFIEPLIFVTVGLIYDVPWQYYLICIGGYYGLMVVWEVAARLLQKDGGRVFHCPFVRKLKQIMAKFAESGEESAEKQPTDEN
jgi:hypothetical protein